MWMFHHTVYFLKSHSLVSLISSEEYYAFGSYQAHGARYNICKIVILIGKLLNFIIDNKYCKCFPESDKPTSFLRKCVSNT